ncbi:MAG: AAA family ATPase [Aliidongia sp.]
MEKAHPAVQDVFFQVFDKGTMKDGEGRDIDFKNTIIIMTSNAGTDLIAQLCADPETAPSPTAWRLRCGRNWPRVFKPAFLGRVTMVPYLPLGQDTLRRVVELQLGRVASRVKQRFGATPAIQPGFD